MNSWKAITAHIGSMRAYLIFAAVLFAAGIYSGAVLPSVQSGLNGQLAQLERIAATLQQSANPSLSFFIVIFFNNVIKSLLVIYLGLFFGVFPVIFLVMNGMILGYVLSREFADIGFSGLVESIIKGILPHGIIELPILILAGAYGLKFGTYAFRFIGQAVTPRSGLSAEFKFFANRTIPISIAIVVLLLVAAGIESTVTLWLAGM
ncbi:stage II sporulation protein M [Paenibacillus beijingensis]|uniref:Stage II sporulation protein M n=1 Tax=Paenibacillus beijingensis TaxID=1126833 RepID=A0A0D5NIW6_9BACL|nr:stage II sporulation protein M [Paenibacillus beijingensis]AJY75309.1 hypothetical protein VN24_12850 [Paenibacillus beijingensis]